MTRVFLHVGTRKSGTTYLQRSLRRSFDALAEQGVNLLYPDRDEHARHQVVPLRRAASGDPDATATAEAAVADLAGWIRERPTMTHVLTNEDLGELPRRSVDLLLDGLAEFEVHLVLTARHWGRTLPSEWQQCMKQRDTVTYTEFLTAARDRTRGARRFLARQDVPGMLDRWGGRLPRERVHVIAVPPPDRAEDTLVDLFSGLVGFDPATLQVPDEAANQSISLPQAEMLRRVNIELDGRMRGDAYSRGVREWLARKCLMRQERSSVRLPAEHVEWCAAATREQYDGMLAREVDLIGNPADLVMDAAGTTGPDRVEPDQGDVLATAVATIADLTEARWNEVQQLRRQLADVTAERDALQGRGPRSLVPRVRRRLGTTARRVRGRVGRA
ncbi:hypothetical protein [Nocardioides sp. YIM 152588]|uniref:hypothetical protein n=1 Tax=Nocardioides sp. YIM 152588 TaxID=3158259 RepID=UPI0032E4CF48